MKKKIAILLAAALMVTSMPFYAFADDSEVPADTPEQTQETVTPEENTEQSQETVTPAEGEETPSEEPQEIVYPCWNDDHTSYFDENGEMVTGVVKITGTKKVTKRVKYYYNKKKKKWQTKKISGAKTKYVRKKKTVATKYLYMFDENGVIVKTKGVFENNGKEYYGLGTGRLKTGWVAIVEKKKGKAVYFNKSTGAMAKGTTVGHLKVPKSGRLGRAYYLGVKRLNKTGWSLKKAYKYSSKIKYQGRYYRAKNSETYAIKGFTKGHGNCYVMAATFYIMAKLLGYDVHQVEGKVDLPHSWTVIKQNGKEWVYDPNFTNETGRNGYKIYYGKKGTWRYNHYHKMN